MTTRKADLVVLVALILVGAGYLSRAYLIASEKLHGNNGPIQYPVAIGVALLALCAVEVFRVVRARSEEADKPFRIPNAGRLLGAIVLVGLYFLAWKWTGYFYVATACFFLAQLLLFNWSFKPLFVARAIGLSAAFSLSLYLVFHVLFGMRLS